MLDRGERKCLHCTLNEVEDESHMFFKCPIYETERATLLIYIQDNCKNCPNNKFTSPIYLFPRSGIWAIQPLGPFLIICFHLSVGRYLVKILYPDFSSDCSIGS